MHLYTTTPALRRKTNPWQYSSDRSPQNNLKTEILPAPLGYDRLELQSNLKFNGKKTITHKGQSVEVELEKEKPRKGSKTGSLAFYNMTVNGEDVGMIGVRPTKSSSLYGNQPYLQIESMGVEDNYQGGGYSRLLTQAAVNLSWKKGYQGRVALKASTDFGSPTGVIYAKDGFKFKDAEKQTLVEQLIAQKRPIEASESPEGTMYLPEEWISYYLSLPPLLD